MSGSVNSEIPSGRLVTELFDIIDHKRWHDLPTVLTEDCVIERPGSPVLEGRERIERFYRHERPIARGRHQIERVLGDAASAACWGTFSGTTEEGQQIQARFAEAFVLRDGRIARRTTYLHQPAH